MKRIFVLTLLIFAILASLTGCNWMDGSYISVTPHQVGYSDEEDTLMISDFIDLRSAVISMIDSGETEGILPLKDYLPQDIRADMIRVKDYVMSTSPIGAYAVQNIDYEYDTTNDKATLSLEISYRHTKTEIGKIHAVYGMDGAKTFLVDTLNNHRKSLVLLVTRYEDMDVHQWITDYIALHPEIVMETPQISIQTYPEQGEARVVEILFSYQNSRDALRQMQNQVSPIFSSAKLYVSTEVDDLTKLEQLYTFLMERFDYKYETSQTPAYSLLYCGVGDSKAFAEVYAAMCRQIGLECSVVSGIYQGQSRYWNLIQLDGIYYHVDLLHSEQSGSLQLMEHEEMSEYQWDQSLYPASGTPVPLLSSPSNGSSHQHPQKS